MKRTLLTILAALAPYAYAAQYWVDGVSKDGGWVDQDKSKNAVYNEYKGNVNVGAGNGTSGYFNNNELTGDGFLCWAASATDILTWWHNQNPGAAQLNPTAPKTQGEIWELFKATYTNDSGTAAAGIEWYMDGKTTVVEPTPRVKPLQGGSYYPGMLEDSQYFSVSQFDEGWVNPVEYDYSKQTPKEEVWLNIADTFVNLIQADYLISLGVSGEHGGHHAITLWGVETDDTTGLLTKMWITDSDDALCGYGTGLIELGCTPIENELIISEDYPPLGTQRAYGITSTGKVYQDGEFEEKEGRLWYDCAAPRNDYFYDFAAFKFSTVAYQGVPEPATGTLSLLALAGLAARRRRK